MKRWTAPLAAAAAMAGIVAYGLRRPAPDRPPQPAAVTTKPTLFQRLGWVMTDEEIAASSVSATSTARQGQPLAYVVVDEAYAWTPPAPLSFAELGLDTADLRPWVDSVREDAERIAREHVAEHRVQHFPDAEGEWLQLLPEPSLAQQIAHQAEERAMKAMFEEAMGVQSLAERLAECERALHEDARRRSEEHRAGWERIVELIRQHGAPEPMSMAYQAELDKHLEGWRETIGEWAAAPIDEPADDAGWEASELARLQRLIRENEIFEPRIEWKTPEMRTQQRVNESLQRVLDIERIHGFGRTHWTGVSGSTGDSTGPRLHLETRGSTIPTNDLDRREATEQESEDGSTEA